MPTLSVVVLTYNEAENIEACLASAKGFADELLVFDSRSKDATRELAAKAGARVIEYAFEDYARQRNAALDAASGDWVFFLDADERASEEIGHEIRAMISGNNAIDANIVLYWVPRRNIIFGKLIKHTGWSPDYQPRLMRRGRVSFETDRPVHELAVPQGAEGYMTAPLLHFNYGSLAEFRERQRAYTLFEAQILFRRGIKGHWRGLIGQPLREFVRRFLTLEGYKDLGYGLFLSILMAYYAFLRQLYLRDLWRKSGDSVG